MSQTYCNPSQSLRSFLVTDSRKSEFIYFLQLHIGIFNKYQAPAHMDMCWKICLKDYAIRFGNSISKKQIECRITRIKSGIRKLVRNDLTGTVILQRWQYKLVQILELEKDNLFWLNGLGTLVSIKHPDIENCVSRDIKDEEFRMDDSNFMKVEPCFEEVHVDEYCFDDNEDEDENENGSVSTASQTSTEQVVESNNRKSSTPNPMDQAIINDIAKDPNRHFLCELGLQLQMLPRIVQMEMKVQLQQYVVNRIMECSNADE